MLTIEYRFSLIFPLLLICSFDLPDSTIQIIRGVPVFHATNAMPKLNQTKVFKGEKAEHLKSLPSTYLSRWFWEKQASWRWTSQGPNITGVFRRHSPLCRHEVGFCKQKLLRNLRSVRRQFFFSFSRRRKQGVPLRFYPCYLLLQFVFPLQG